MEEKASTVKYGKGGGSWLKKRVEQQSMQQTKRGEYKTNEVGTPIYFQVHTSALSEIIIMMIKIMIIEIKELAEIVWMV